MPGRCASHLRRPTPTPSFEKFPQLAGGMIGRVSQFSIGAGGAVGQLSAAAGKRRGSAVNGCRPAAARFRRERRAFQHTCSSASPSAAHTRIWCDRRPPCARRIPRESLPFDGFAPRLMGAIGLGQLTRKHTDQPIPHCAVPSRHCTGREGGRSIITSLPT